MLNTGKNELIEGFDCFLKIVTEIKMIVSAKLVQLLRVSKSYADGKVCYFLYQHLKILELI